ncbi:MAG: MATE family efflux transporter [Ruminococcaceae bacterium]|nr:MATE family efflux transporter [Oscillospiraceae bacterium]
MTQNRDFLATEKIPRLLFRIAIPTVIAQIVNLLYNLVDRIYIGHIDVIGKDALTGVGVCFPILTAVSAFASLVGGGGAPRASIKMGQKDHESARKIVGSCFALLLCISVILTIVLSVFAEDMLLLFGASENTVGYAVEYIRTYLLGTIFVQCSLGMNPFITAQGFTKISMLSVIIGAALNIALDPLFIFVFDMGVSGAALATVISQAASAVWVISFLAGKKSVLRLTRDIIRVDWRILLPCLALGVSPFIMSLTESLLSVSFNSSLLRYGGDTAVGAMTILTSLMQFSLLPLSGFTQGAQPVTSYNYGAGNWQRVKESFTVILTVCLCYSVGIWTLIQLFPEFFVLIFNDNQSLVSYAAWAMRIYFGATLFFGAQIACQNTFIALGNAKMSLLMAVLRKLILLIPLIYILPLFFETNADKAMAVYLAEPIADFLAVLTTVTTFTLFFRKTLRQMQKKEEVTTHEKV